MHETVATRQARHADADAVAAFTRDTWGEERGDYVPRVFDRWVETDGPRQHTVVATVPREEAERIAGGDGVDPVSLVEGDGTGAAADGEEEAVVGCIQGVLLSEWEAWGQGIRVDPAFRGRGVSTALSDAVFEWAREAGATVCRNMVFSWNVPGLGQSRSVGFEPETEFRFATPVPDPDAETRPEATAHLDVVDDPDPDAAWACWSRSDARDHLRGLALDGEESWACSTLTREQLAAAAADDRLVVVADERGAVAGFTYRVRTSEYGSGTEATTYAEYGAAAWDDETAASLLLDAVARDAAAVGADETRVFIPETVEHVSDVAACRVRVADEPDFVMCADLTDAAVGSGRR